MIRVLFFALLLPLTGCELVAPIAVVNHAFVMNDERLIGDRSVPVGSREATLAQGHSYRGLVAVSPTQQLFVVPYNSLRRGESQRAEQFFGIGIRLMSISNERSDVSLDPSQWTLTLSDGKKLSPSAQQLSGGPGISPCWPGYRPQSPPALNNSAGPVALELRGGSTRCLEIYFQTPPPAPSLPFRLYISSIREGESILEPVEIAFETHYGR